MCISTFWYFTLIFSLFLYDRYYTKARDVLYHYSHMPSFHGIHQDCDEIVKQLIVQLREQLRNPKVMFSDLVEWNPCLLLFFSSTFMDVSFDGSRKEISRIYSELCVHNYYIAKIWIQTMLNFNQFAFSEKKTVVCNLILYIK